MLYHLSPFVTPALYQKQTNLTLAYIPIPLLLFFTPLPFSYFIFFPFLLHFIIPISNHLHLHQVIAIHHYFTFLIHLTLPFPFFFHIPLLFIFLTTLPIITPIFLSKIRNYPYFL
ncbi:twin-arginine translocase subunit TatC, partial [Bacillus altitudinis]|uniref:twin-arginine translocase subunit TatC n=1 Tax=Bacillus altitudinis TaxID=293387 RepID=UPI001F2AB4F8